ncbi:hypothetical protein LguiB_008312 [Lonicera macranthoides]
MRIILFRMSNKRKEPLSNVKEGLKTARKKNNLKRVHIEKTEKEAIDNKLKWTCGNPW